MLNCLSKTGGRLYGDLFLILGFQCGLKLCSQYELKHFSSNHLWSPHEFYTSFHDWRHLLKRHFRKGIFHKYCTLYCTLYILVSTLLKNLKLYLIHFVYLVFCFYIKMIKTLAIETAIPIENELKKTCTTV